MYKVNYVSPVDGKRTSTTLTPSEVQTIKTYITIVLDESASSEMTAQESFSYALEAADFIGFKKEKDETIKRYLISFCCMYIDTFVKNKI